MSNTLFVDINDIEHFFEDNYSFRVAENEFYMLSTDNLYEPSQSNLLFLLLEENRFRNSITKNSRTVIYSNYFFNLKELDSLFKQFNWS